MSQDSATGDAEDSDGKSDQDEPRLLSDSSRTESDEDPKILPGIKFWGPNGDIWFVTQFMKSQNVYRAHDPHGKTYRFNQEYIRENILPSETLRIETLERSEDDKSTGSTSSVADSLSSIPDS